MSPWGNLGTGHRLGVISNNTYFDDFSSDNWVDNDSGAIGVSGGTLAFIISGDDISDNNASVHDLNTELGNNVSDSAWVLRFKINFSSLTDNKRLFIGISDSDQTVGRGNSQDFIGMGWESLASNGYVAQDTDDEAINITGEDGTQAFAFTTSEDYYCEIIRTSTTTYTVEVFTNSDYLTGSQGKINGSCAETTNNLRYIKIMNPVSANLGVINGNIDDMEFYDGVVSP